MRRVVRSEKTETGWEDKKGLSKVLKSKRWAREQEERSERTGKIC